MGWRNGQPPRSARTRNRHDDRVLFSRLPRISSAVKIWPCGDYQSVSESAFRTSPEVIGFFLRRAETLHGRPSRMRAETRISTGHLNHPAAGEGDHRAFCRTRV